MYCLRYYSIGTGDSGKSTFAKQMKIMYKGGFTQKELENYAELLLSRTVLSMHALIRATRQLKIRTGSRLKVPFRAALGSPSPRGRFSRPSRRQSPCHLSFIIKI